MRRQPQRGLNGGDPRAAHAGWRPFMPQHGPGGRAPATIVQAWIGDRTGQGAAPAMARVTGAGGAVDSTQPSACTPWRRWAPDEPSRRRRRKAPGVATLDRG